MNRPGYKRPKPATADEQEIARLLVIIARERAYIRKLEAATTALLSRTEPAVVLSREGGRLEAALKVLQRSQL
jgi:hypothetical protein